MTLGQRYSLVLNASQPVDSYWICALPNSGWNGLAHGFDGGVNPAILRYYGAQTAEPTTSQQTDKIMLQETALAPLISTPVPGEPHVKGGYDNMFFNFTFNRKTRYFEVNGHSFMATGVPAPVLLQILEGSRPPYELLPKENIFYVERNKTVEVNFPALPLGGPHPFHLHGVRFAIDFQLSISIFS